MIEASQNTLRFRERLDATRRSLQELKMEEANRDKNQKLLPPFSNNDDLNKWWTQQQTKRKNKRAVRLDGKKTAKQHAARHDQHATSAPLSPDPWEFLEREQLDAASAARAEEEAVRANGAHVQYPERPEFVSEFAWAEFLDYIDDRAAKDRQIKKLQEQIAEMTQEDGRLSAIEAELRNKANDAKAQRDEKQRELIGALFDVDQLLVFRQGHVEYHQDPFITEYGNAVLIETARVNALNADIKVRGGEKIEFLKKEAKGVRDLREIEWETRLHELKCRVSEIEWRHLGWLRVTKHMQEFINGGGHDHNERQRAKLVEKIEHVRKTMTQRIEDKKVLQGKVKRQTREREIENSMLLEQVGHADSLVATRRHVHSLHAADHDAELPQRLMRDMRVTRRLEDVARAQNDEMAALKREVDRLRERTFPSFAVVSKRVIGNAQPPDLILQRQLLRPQSSRP